MFVPNRSYARDDGRFTNSPLKEWFDGLASRNGLCCAFAVSVDGGTLTAKARDGGEMKIKLADNAPINEVVKATLSDIKEGSYLAITASPQPDGSQKAMAILIFPQW